MIQEIQIQGYAETRQQREAEGGKVLGWVEIRGVEKREEVERRVKEVVERHEVLRTRYVEVGGGEGEGEGKGKRRKRVQVVEEGMGVEIRYEDWRGKREEERKRGREEVWEQERGKAMDWRRGPVVRARMMELGGGDWWMVVGVAGESGDARSLRNMVGEMVERGDGGEGRGEILQYGQYGAWQEGLRESEEGEAGREYWGRRGGEKERWREGVGKREGKREVKRRR